MAIIIILTTIIIIIIVVVTFSIESLSIWLFSDCRFGYFALLVMYLISLSLDREKPPRNSRHQRTERHDPSNGNESSDMLTERLMCDFRLPPRSRWELRSFGLLGSEWW
jgi:hypothetical protein